MVSQEPILFNDTIYNNITLGTGGTTEEQVDDAAKVANAHNFILKKKRRLPDRSRRQRLPAQRWRTPAGNYSPAPY